MNYVCFFNLLLGVAWLSDGVSYLRVVTGSEDGRMKFIMTLFFKFCMLLVA